MVALSTIRNTIKSHIDVTINSVCKILGHKEDSIKRDHFTLAKSWISHASKLLVTLGKKFKFEVFH